MTCIAGIKDGNKVWIGGDSFSSNGQNLQRTTANPKVFHCGSLLIGACGDANIGDAMECVFEAPEMPQDTDPRRYLLRDFLPALREFLKDTDALQTQDGQQIMPGGLLIGCRGRLFNVGSSFDCDESVQGYEAIGCIVGVAAALGALYALYDTPLSPSDRAPESLLRSALEAAAAHCDKVAGPFAIVCLEK